MDSPAVHSQWQRVFPHRSRRVLWHTQPRLYFMGLERPGNDADHSHPSSVEVKERVELYLYSPSEPSWPVLGRKFKICCSNQYIIVYCSYTAITYVVCWFRIRKDEGNALIQRGCKVMVYWKAIHSVHFIGNICKWNNNGKFYPICIYISYELIKITLIALKSYNNYEIGV
jgi:hypothetical protein